MVSRVVHCTTPGGAIHINFRENGTTWWSGGEHQGITGHKEESSGHLNKWVWNGTMRSLGGNSAKSELSLKGRCQWGRHTSWVKQRRVHYSQGPKLHLLADWLVQRPESGRSSSPQEDTATTQPPPLLPHDMLGSTVPELPNCF